MTRRVVLAKVVDRFHEPPAHERRPEPVHEVAGEAAVAGIGDPVGQGVPQRAGDVTGRRDHRGNLREAVGGRRIRDRIDEQLVYDLVGCRLLHGAARFDRRGQGRIVIGRAGQRPVRLDGCRRSSGVWPIERRPLHPLSRGIEHSHRPVGLTAHRASFAEERGEAVVLTLGPDIERMIVAAGALHPDAEQCLRDDTGHLQRVGIFGGEVADGAIVARSANGREQLPHDLVVGHAVAHASPQEPVELRATGRAGTHAKHVADPDRPAIGETVARDQSSNEPAAAHGGRLRSVEPAFGDGGNPADEIDRDPPEVSRVVDQGSRGEPLCLA